MNTKAMKPAIEWSTGATINPVTVVRNWPAPTPLVRTKQYALRLLLAALPALTIVLGTAWIVSTFAAPGVLHAVLWAAGFVFLALAMESSKANAGALLATGLALPLLAILSSWVASEFAIIAAALIAAWVGAKDFPPVSDHNSGCVSALLRGQQAKAAHFKPWLAAGHCTDEFGARPDQFQRPVGAVIILDIEHRRRQIGVHL